MNIIVRYSNSIVKNWNQKTINKLTIIVSKNI